MPPMIEALRQLVRQHADAHANPDGFAATPLRGIQTMRAHAPTGFVKSIYKPLICLVLQGSKYVTVGTCARELTAGQTVVVSADVPAISRITRASRAEPYVAVAIELDLSILLELAGQVSVSAEEDALAPALSADDTDPAVAECALRLIQLLGRPNAIPVLFPSIMRELHYWLLTGRHGAAMRGLAWPDGVGQRVARAIAVLRSEFASTLEVGQLAAIAGMSASTFHHHFRTITSLSPIQFQKRLRLIEARRRMLAEGLPASQAAFAVGYESVSQFTREYGRMYGLPPGRDRSETRAA